MRPCWSRRWSIRARPAHGRNPSWRPVSWSALAGPELVLVETGNILRRLERAGDVSRLEATTAYRDRLRLDLALFPFAPFAERIWELRSNLTGYDAWHVAVVEALDCPLVTPGLKLGRATGPRCDIVVPPRRSAATRQSPAGGSAGVARSGYIVPCPVSCIASRRNLHTPCIPRHRLVLRIQSPFRRAPTTARGTLAACRSSSPVVRKTHTCRSARRALYSWSGRALSQEIHATFGFRLQVPSPKP